MSAEEGRSKCTKVYYYLEDNTPYMSQVPAPESTITLRDFKKVFTRKGYKYFCKQIDKTLGCEVKVEIRDDSTRLQKSANGLIELVLMSTGAPGPSGGTLPRTVAKKAKNCAPPIVDKQETSHRKRRSLHELGGAPATNGEVFEERCNGALGSNKNSVTASSLSTVLSKRAGEGLAEIYTSNSEDPYRFDDVNSRFSMQSGVRSSVYAGVAPVGNVIHTSRAHRQRRPRRERYRKAYVPSTISSITESSLTSLSLPRIDLITLSMKNDVPLGISVLSHDGGIFVSDILKGGAVALDGRIEVGDQIVQVNRSSFENLSDGEAVQLLRQAAASRKPITLYVAKRPCNSDSRSDILAGLASETLPIDISLWVESAQQNNVKPLRPFAVDETNSGLGEDVTLGAADDTDVERAYAERRDGLGALRSVAVPPRGVTAINGGGALARLNNAEDVARRRENEENEQLVDSLNVNMDPVTILKYMARPDSGLQIKNRKWLKIPVPMSFIGRELVDWLLDHVHGIQDRKAARLFASGLLAAGHIKHVVNKLTFTEKCYYVFDESLLSARNTHNSDSSAGKTGVEVTTEVTYVGSPPPPALPPRLAMRNFNHGPPLALAGRLPPDIDQSWPLSPITVYGPTQHRSDCESPVTNDYASVIGADVVTSTMLAASMAEAPTLKLGGHRGLNERGCLRRRPDVPIPMSQPPPNTPNSILLAQRTVASAASDTEFEVIDDDRRTVVSGK